MTPTSLWFGPFRLDAERRALYRGASCRSLSERLFQLLLAFLESNGEIVTRDALAVRVWGEEGVTDANLTQHIYLLREILGERRGERSYILTIGGSGYRFSAAVTANAADLEDVGGDALRHYCNGNYLLDRRTAAALRGAVSAFEASVKAYPKFVRGFVGLARAWALLSEYWHVPGPVGMPKARSYVDRALELDPRSTMALSMLSEIQLCGEWDWPKSQGNLETALSAEPSLAFARNNAAWFHLYRGEFDKAAAEVREGLASQPASLPLQLLHGRILSHAGKHEEALAAISSILAMDPNFIFARRFLTMAYILAERPDRALETIASEVPDESEDAVYRLPLLACAHARLGDTRGAEAAYEALRTLSRQHYVSSWSLAMAAANCGLESEALALLADAQHQRDSALLLLPILPVFTSLEHRPEFTSLIRGIAA